MTTYQKQIKSTGVNFSESTIVDERPHICIDWEYADSSKEGGDSYETFTFDSEEDARKAFAALDLNAAAHRFSFAADGTLHVKSLWLNGEQVKS